MNKIEVRVFSIKLVKDFLDSLYGDDYYNFDACFDEMIEKIEITGNHHVEMKYKNISNDFRCDIEIVEVTDEQLENGYNSIKIID